MSICGGVLVAVQWSAVDKSILQYLGYKVRPQSRRILFTDVPLLLGSVILVVYLARKLSVGDFIIVLFC